MSRIFITGVSGFVGKHLCKFLSLSDHYVRGASRSKTIDINHKNFEYFAIDDLNLKINWRELLSNQDTVIHCAGRAHIIKETIKIPLELYRLINVEATRELAKQAAEVGVKKFIFLSSIGVLGENTNARKPFTIFDKPNPIQDYAISKYEAEQTLLELSSKTGLEVTIIRPPLVYGSQSKGNLSRLIKLINSGIPIPFGAIKNHRSMIGMDNLVDLIIRCIDHPNAKNKTFLVSDDEDLSTPDLIKLIAKEMGCSVSLFPVPIPWLKFFSFFIGRQSDIDRLTGSLQVDIEYTKKILDWKPSVSVSEGIKRMFNNY
jgi:nucleoside-diphosphate-sugar epimerase